MEEEKQPCYRLEFSAVTRRKSGGLTGYGFAVFVAETGCLVATGCGPVHPFVSFNQATHIALLEGLRVAQAHGAQRLLLQSDSSLVMKQLQRIFDGSSIADGDSPLAAALDGMSHMMGQVQLEKVDRWANGLAVIQAEFATELLLLLGKVCATTPSKYAQVAGQLGLLLQLPVAVRRLLEGADNFADTVAELVALRCGTSKDSILAAIAAGGGSSSSSSTGVVAAAAAAVGADIMTSMVPFSLRRVYTPQEGAAYAAAAAAAGNEAAAAAATAAAVAGLVVPDGDDHLPPAEEPSAPPPAADDAPSRLLGGRVVGRHRLTHRLLVVGFHKLPEHWTPGQQQQQQTEAPAVVGPLALQQQDANSSKKSSVHAVGQPDACNVGEVPSHAGASSETAAAAAGSVELDEELVPSWVTSTGAASSSEGAGLGTQRYQLPQVTSDTATHLLQFDGASRNNPGRGGYGYVIFDLTSGRLVARGCMSLPYGQTAGRAEFEGLLAGLKAALEAGIRHLAVQGDSALVLDALMYRRGIASKDASVAYQKATQLCAQFDHVDFQYIPRQQNTLADRLAQMSMDIDTALYALLRRDERGVSGLRVLTKAARMNKKQHVLELLMSSYSFPLLLVVTLQRVMSLSPAALLARLQDKAAHLGDPNPWLVQEVRKLVEAGIPEDIMEHVGAVVLDSRYRGADMQKLKQLAALRGKEQQPQEQKPQYPQPPLPQRDYAQLPQKRRYSWIPAAGIEPVIAGHSSSSTWARQQEQQHVPPRLLARPSCFPMWTHTSSSRAPEQSISGLGRSRFSSSTSSSGDGSSSSSGSGSSSVGGDSLLQAASLSCHAVDSARSAKTPLFLVVAGGCGSGSRCMPVLMHLQWGMRLLRH